MLISAIFSNLFTDCSIKVFDAKTGGAEVIVNIARNKLLINKNRVPSRFNKSKKRQPRCNHCGGLVRIDNEFSTCMMCSRDAEHVCGTCAYASPEKIAEGKRTA